MTTPDTTVKEYPKECEGCPDPCTFETELDWAIEGGCHIKQKAPIKEPSE